MEEEFKGLNSHILNSGRGGNLVGIPYQHKMSTVDDNLLSYDFPFPDPPNKQRQKKLPLELSLNFQHMHDK
jgi:hypothetical protein